MISIEKDEDRLNRFTSNLPFRCVTLEPGASNDILPKLNWTKPTILWLDYDSRLKDNALTDIDFFCSNAGVGSVVIITVNSKPEPFPNPKPPGNFRLDQLKERVGEDNLPTYVTSDSDLNGWKMAKVCRDIITNKIEATLSGRNGVLPEEKRLLYKQLFHFNYSDGAEMLTVGGLLFDAEHDSNVGACDFESLAYISLGEEPFLIVAPPLTHRELMFLDTQLPRHYESDFGAHGIPERVIEFYSKFYRYFPRYADVDV